MPEEEESEKERARKRDRKCGRREKSQERASVRGESEQVPEEEREIKCRRRERATLFRRRDPNVIISEERDPNGYDCKHIATALGIRNGIST